MSMPEPIFVALVGASVDVVRRGKKYFRLSEPGIGAALLATLEPISTGSIRRLVDLPSGLVTLWVALDDDSFVESRRYHQADLRNPRYSRGFYEGLLPEPCILVDFENREAESKKRLAELAQTIIKAWYATS